MKPQRTVKMPLRRPPAPRPRPRKAAPPIRARAAAIEEDYEIEDYEAEAEPNMRFSHALFVVLILHVIAVGGVFAFNSIKARQTGETATAQSKTEESPAGQPAPDAAKAPSTTAAAKAPAAPAPSGAKAPAGAKTHVVAAGETLTKIASLAGVSIEAIEKANGLATYSVLRVGQELIIPEAGADRKAAASATKPAIASVAKTSDAKASTATPEQFLAASKSAPAPAAPAAKAATEAPAAASGETYTVVKGDNPYSIAKRLKISYKKLLELNNIADPTKIQIGQQLKLPQPES